MHTWRADEAVAGNAQIQSFHLTRTDATHGPSWLVPFLTRIWPVHALRPMPCVWHHFAICRSSTHVCGCILPSKMAHVALPGPSYRSAEGTPSTTDQWCTRARKRPLA